MRNKALFIAIVVCFLARILFFFFVLNPGEGFYWEYGEIAKNLLNGRGYSLFYLSGDSLGFTFNPGFTPYVSAFMPPGFVVFLLPFLAIKNYLVADILIFTLLSLISCGTVYLLYKFACRSFSENIALITAFVYAVFPQFIFASGRNGTTVIFHFLIILVFYFLYSEKPVKIFILSVILGIMLYFRQEIILYAFFILLTFIFKKRFKNAILMFIIIFLMILPWQIRNYAVFERVVPLSSSTGLNFYRGHNPYRPGVWLDEETMKKQKSFSGYYDFELKMNDMYFGLALKAISDNPAAEIRNSAVKLSHLWFYFPYDKRTGNIIYMISWFLILLSSLYGLYRTCSWRKHNYIYLFLIFYSMNSVIFFALPRYQIMMQIALLPFSAVGLEFLYLKFKKSVFL